MSAPAAPGRVRLGADQRLPLLGVRAGDLPPRALVVGDPGRAERAAARLDDARELGRTREYVTFTGRHGGVDLAVVSHGVGAPGAAVCFEELCRAGVAHLVRAGTAGGLQPDVRPGDLVVATGAIRDDGYSAGVVPPTFPAVADPRHVVALVEAGLARGPAPRTGIVLSSAVFYPHEVFAAHAGDGHLALWQRAGATAVEMEAAALFVVASLHGAAAGAVLAIDGNPADDADMRGYDPRRPEVDAAVERMLGIALEVLVGTAGPSRVRYGG